MNPNTRSQIWTRLFFVRDYYDDPIDRSTAQGILIVSWMGIIGSLLRTVALTIRPENSTAEILLSPIWIIFGIIGFVLLWRGALRTASRLLVILSIIAAGAIVLLTPQPNRFLITILPIVLAGVLLERSGIILTGIMITVVTVLSELNQQFPGTIELAEVLFNAFTIVAVMGAAVTVQAIFVGRQRLIAIEAKTMTEGFEQVLAGLESLDKGMTRNDALSNMIRLLRRMYQLDSVQVYLADSEARLHQLIRAGLRRTEIIDLEEDEILTPGTPHPLSDAARYQRPIHTTLSSPVPRREYFMPAMQQGLVLPLIDGETLMGVIDIQSSTAEPFSQEQIRSITLIVGSFATLANLLQSNELLDRSLREQEVVASRAQSQLASEQAQRQEMVSNIWSEYINQRGEGVVGFDVQGKRVTRAADMPDEMREALAKRGEYLRVADNEKILSVPILLRGETLGAMSFALDTDHVVTDRQVELAKTIALRLGSALENTRLLEQTRQRAARERKATEISAQLFSANDIDSLLKLAADNFNDTLGAIQTRIFVEPGKLTEPAPNNTSSNGGQPNGHNPNGDHA